MAPRADYVSGTITLTNGSTAFTGTGTGWLAAGFQEGDTIIDVTGATEYMGVIASISANGSGTLTKNWEGPNLTAVAYRIRYHADGQRVTAQSRELIELLGNGNLQAFAALTGANEKIAMFTGPGAMTLINKSDLVSGVNYNVQVDVLADRDAYDLQATGYAVLVNDFDGTPLTPRAAITSKNSDADGDWSLPAYITGVTGAAPTLDNVTVTDVAYNVPGSGSLVETSPDVYDLELSLPKGRGYNFLGSYSGVTAYDPDDTVLYNNATWRAKITTTGNAPPTLPTTSNTQWELVAGSRGYTDRGAYSGATAYVIDDTVLDNGSTWRALGSTTGNAPPTLPTTSNAYWTLVARKGTDGAGTGDVVGPTGATADRIAVFDGTTGKLVKDGGKTIATIDASIATIDASIATKIGMGKAVAAAIVFG